MKYKLKDIFDLQMGKTPSRNNPTYWNTEDYKWISIADLSKTGMYILDTKEYLSEKAILESGIKVIPANTVVMSFKLSIGKTAITSEDMYSNEAIMSFHDKHIVEILPEYLFYMFKYKNWDEGSNKAVMGKTLNKATLSEVMIEICSSEKQKEIVNILNKMTHIIKLRQQQLSELDTLIKARFVEMFGDPVLNSFGWCRVSLSEVTSKIGSGATPKGGKESYRSEGISLIRSMNVHDGKFKYKDLAHITEKQAKQLNNVIVEENDVLVNITGASIARTCVVPKNVLPARVNQHVAIIRCDCEQVQPVFLNNLFLNIRFKKMLLSMGENGGATRQAITKQQLENIDVIVPPLSLQNEFAAFVQQIDKLRFGGRKRLTKAKNTKNNNRNTITLERSTLYGK